MTNKEAIYFLKKVIINYGEDTDEWDCCVQAIDLAIKALENERPKGKKEIKKPYGWQYCSECGMVVEPQDNFCWFCGADMREADNE